ncbi:MAG: hypothetical protein ACM3S3_09005 [Candidatus Doudnabacteria bacterium]
MLRQAALVLLMAAVLAPAGRAARNSHVAVPSAPRPPAQRVVVRTELVPASSDGFDWLDAAAGFGLAIVSGGVALLVVAGHRPRFRYAKN